MFCVNDFCKARIGNDEYALGQSHDLALPPTENARMLREEFTNIHLAEAIREEFFTTALECEVNVPGQNHSSSHFNSI
jgi:hypothetical protein